MIYVAQEILAFTSSNITEAYPDWSSTTTYSFESGTPTSASVARYDTWYYRSVINNNLNQNPHDFENVKWVRWAISNKLAMLDLSANSKSVKTGGNLTVTFEQNRMDSLVIGNYEAQEVTVEILDTDGTTVLWSSTLGDTLNEQVEDYYTYIYSPYGYEVDRAVYTPLPLWGKYVRVTFVKSVDATQTACGFLVGGVAVNMGDTLSKVSIGFNSYATKEYDQYGNLSIIKRAVQDLVDFETIIESDMVPTLRRRVKLVYNDIVCFILDESTTSQYENLITLGTVQDVDIVLSDFTKTTLTWSIVEAV